MFRLARQALSIASETKIANATVIRITEPDESIQQISDAAVRFDRRLRAVEYSRCMNRDARWTKDAAQILLPN